MDPNKSPSAPPSGWTDEKSVMMQNPPPPPYQDGPQPGAPHFYPPQPQGYGMPQQYGAEYNQQAYNMGQQYPSQPNTVMVQPTVYVARGPLVNPVNDYLGYSIFTMLCCCMPLGIAALIYSISTREANHTGDQLAAERNSRTARTLNHVALGLGLGSLVLCIIYVIVIVVVHAHN
ncbi:proline-rich transmembrane protein 1 [Austrofundulus limnaeus]|uniref:Proline-rich transmembrane protein 1 n=1 Tax=Austrofundulus limnaeus TaxID=52670 RepID=A0A2I4CI25_AUSLI|nr:PREDICTED: proline-rich transmembrane protein 1-like [Austrofundulus limnaeus]